MPAEDGFVDLARFYDAIMSHVDYDRWRLVTMALSELLPRPFVHLDTACGTGVLLKRLRADGWDSLGLDLSYAMVRQGRRHNPAPAAVADLRALPVAGSIDYATCLFDSVNFLLDETDLRETMGQFAAALRPNGLLYFDIVTERMVLEHFAGQTWTENSGRLATSWSCSYDRNTHVAESRIRVNNGPVCTIRERIYDREVVEDALAKAGFEILAIADAESWRPPRKQSVRIDFVAVNGDAGFYAKAFRKVRGTVRGLFV
ncbi:MAG: class I SAM-dependent methyltransferase [Candidatus Hydrogenedentes bacterium]|nr:class I SAM-dependent methyltransferase [Candidatus Hydrogenedentota bacterium]